MKHMTAHQETPEEILGRHAHRPIRALLRRPPALQNEAEASAELAFWDVIYRELPRVSYQRALDIASECLNSPRRIQEVLDGWRPKSLGR